MYIFGYTGKITNKTSEVSFLSELSVCKVPNSLYSIIQIINLHVTYTCTRAGISSSFLCANVEISILIRLLYEFTTA